MNRLLIAAAFLISTGSIGLAQTTQPSADGTSAPAKSLPAEQMLSQMLKPTPNATAKPLQQPAGAQTPDATSGKGAVAPNTPAVNVMREGTFLVDRTGRLTRSSDGQQMEFAFDADSKAMHDPPVIILPNLKLMAMENAVQGSSRDLHFRITGMVTEYRGRNYVLLEKVVVVPDAAQQF